MTLRPLQSHAIAHGVVPTPGVYDKPQLVAVRREPDINNGALRCEFVENFPSFHVIQENRPFEREGDLRTVVG